MGRMIIGKNSRIFLQRLNLRKGSTIWEQRGMPCDFEALRTLRPMLLSVHVMMRRRRGRRLMMMMIRVFVANARTVRIAHGSHCSIGTEERQCKNNRR
jgi:hypothetical protein